MSEWFQDWGWLLLLPIGFWWLAYVSREPPKQVAARRRQETFQARIAVFLLLLPLAFVLGRGSVREIVPTVIQGWGRYEDRIWMQVNAKLLVDHRPNRLLVACRANDRAVDPYSDPHLAKSRTFRIGPPIMIIEVVLAAEFSQRIEEFGDVMCFLCVVPPRVAQGEFSTIDDLKLLGGSVYKTQVGVRSPIRR